MVNEQPGKRERRRLRLIRWLALFGTALLVFAGGVILVNTLKRDTEPSTSQRTRVTEEVALWNEDRASELAADLTSGDPARVVQAYALPGGQTLDKALVPALAMMQISFDLSTFNLEGDGLARVEAELSGEGRQSSVWTVFLLQVDDRWKVVATEGATEP